MTAQPQFEIALVTDVLKCPGCDHIWTNEDDINEPLYECEEHGLFSRRQTEQGNHQCPECSKFGSKVADVSCPEECTEELESLPAYEIEGNLYVSIELLDE